MGKLVSGIIAVILLQVAFFAYTAMYWQGYSRTELSKTDPADRGKNISVPPVVDPATEQLVESRLPETSKVSNAAPKGPSSSRRRNASTRVARAERTTPRRTAFRHDRPSPARSASAGVQRDRNTIEQTPSAARGGSTVLVVDNLPVTRELRAADTAKPKKRSPIARAFTGLVKKPWNWMKSIASKLN